MESKRRGECTSARYEVARSDRHSRPAVQQANARRAVVEHASLDADDVVGTIRLHGEIRIGEDTGVRNGRYIGSALRVNTAETGTGCPPIEEDERVIDEGVPATRGARHVDAVLSEIPNRTANNIDLFAGYNTDAIKAAPEPLEVEPFEHDPARCPRIDDDAIRPGHQNAGVNVI